MSSSYLSLHYHVVFSTKNREAIIDLQWWARLHEYLGGTVRGLGGFPEGIGSVRALEIPLAEHAEQTAIAEVLTDMDAELAASEQRREKTRALKQGMMQELLTGRIRLV